MPISSPGSQQPISSNRLFLSAEHREVLSALAHVFAGPPCLASVTGDAGLGKTTLLTEAVVGWPGPVRFVRGASFTIQTDLAGLAVAAPGSTPAIIVIDDAHEMGATAFEQLSTAVGGAARLHIVLVGRTEFWHRARNPAYASLDRLIAHRSVLFPMPYAEAESYLDHVFRIAGCSAAQMLDETARHDLLLRAQGNIRRMNLELSSMLSRPTRRGNIMPRRRAWKRRRRVLQGAIACALAGTAVALAGLLVIAPERFNAWPRIALSLGTAASGQQRSAPQAASTLDFPPAPLAAAVPAADITASPAPAPNALPAPPASGQTADSTSVAPSPDVDSGPSVPSPPLVGNSAPWAPRPDGALASQGEAAEIPAPAPTRAPSADRAATATSLPTDRGAPAARPLTAALPPEEIAGLLRRGKELLALHDISGARRFYERVATDGRGPMQAQAAAELASTYDPARQAAAPWDPQPDISVALAWYRVAASLGDEKSQASVARLESRLP